MQAPSDEYLSASYQVQLIEKFEQLERPAQSPTVSGNADRTPDQLPTHNILPLSLFR